jgi:tRNA-specific 2-thiouridylase
MPFINDYAHGLTPNPCISCNRTVRWDYLFKQAMTTGAEFLATGHYARIAQSGDNSFQLLRGVDPAKDQSYVLHVLSQHHLQHALFPLGEYTKAQVRQLAHKYSLPVSERPDSQDLCFIGDSGDYRHFLLDHAPQALIPGKIIDLQGNILGFHRGLANFTIGQRKGIGVASPTPLYVLEKDLSANALIVGPHVHSGSCQLIADNMNWLAGCPPKVPFNATVKIRYKSRDLPCIVDHVGADRVHIKLEDPAFDITPGQAAVLYNGEVCLGGGIISDELE